MCVCMHLFIYLFMYVFMHLFIFNDSNNNNLPKTSEYGFLFEDLII